jgi:hypothetical protein
MKKIFGAVFAALALAAIAAVPKSSAVTGASLPNTAPVKSIPLIHTLKNVSGHIDVRYRFSFTPSPDNPAEVDGANVRNSAVFVADVNPATRQAVADCSLALQNIVFSKVGNYTFTIAESESSDEINFPHDSENKYDIYFQVTNKLDANNEPTGELAVSLLNQMYSYKEDAKVSFSARFETSANYTYVSLQNKVSGAGADSDKYFKYKVSFENLPENTALTVAGQDAEVEYNGETIQTSSTQTGDVYVYLKHGQAVTIGKYESGDVVANEIPQNTSYTIEKLDEDDYETKLDGETEDTISKIAAAIGADTFAASNVTIASNDKGSTVNTGVFAMSWPFLLAAGLGLSGFFVFRRLSRAS